MTPELTALLGERDPPPVLAVLSWHRLFQGFCRQPARPSK